MENNWIKAEKTWDEYPIGTKAQAIGGGYWEKNKRGWGWCNGGATFPTPGGDNNGMICLPQAPAELAADEYYASEKAKIINITSDLPLRKLDFIEGYNQAKNDIDLYEFAKKWYKQALVDFGHDEDLMEDGVDADFYMSYMQQFPETE